MVKGEYILFGGLIRLTNSSTIIPFSTVTIPTEHGWNAVAVSKSMAVNVKLIFDLGLTIAPEGTILHKIFTEDLATPILIFEYINKGFVIISHFEMTRNIEQYKDIIYEVLMYVYLRSYKTSEYKKEWITTKVPDYEIVGGT